MYFSFLFELVWIAMYYVAIMFVQATKSRCEKTKPTSYLVRESFRTSQLVMLLRHRCGEHLRPDLRRCAIVVALALSGQTCVVLERIESSNATGTTVGWPCCETWVNVSD